MAAVEFFVSEIQNALRRTLHLDLQARSGSDVEAKETIQIVPRGTIFEVAADEFSISGLRDALRPASPHRFPRGDYSGMQIEAKELIQIVPRGTIRLSTRLH